MDKRVEAMARAIDPELSWDETTSDPMFNRLFHKYQQAAINKAKAAITALEAAGYAVVPVANCVQCGRIIDTRETYDGGDEHGSEIDDGIWVCSLECYDAVTQATKENGDG